MSLMLTTNFAGMALAKEGANLSQCANGDADDGPPTPCVWHNGNLGQNNSQYAEGDGVGFRSILDDLQDGDTYEFTIGWDTIQSSSIAYDYLVSWDYTESGDPAADTGHAGAGSDSTIAIPADPRITNEGVTPAGGQFEAWGLNLTGVSAYSYEDGGTATDPLPFSTMETTVTVTFVAATGGTGEAVLAWGGHIATTPDWTPRTTA
ncbi:MAG: hypothetical protein R3249_04355, partial [Nitriliruptorales bacterium]|nr:hypothetical protein [Nitriliruptorales bacterium]